jgi:Na+-transporting methylmalonyl-CoA/oxaloacetate decarboxylase gamma subunit
MTQALEKGLTLTLMGLVIVFLVLACIALVITLIRRLDERWQHRERKEEIEAFGKDPTIDGTTLVLIAAAAATFIQGRFRIRRIRRLPSGSGRASAWSREGRSVLMGSHVITRKK